MLSLRHIVFVVFSLLILSTSLFSQDGFTGINCGELNDYTTPSGEFYSADQQYTLESGLGYIGGSTGERELAEIYYDTEGANNLVRRWREGDFSYRFDVDPGRYVVKIRLAEMVYHGPGFRTFSISIEDNQVISEIDVAEEVGRAYGMLFRFPVDCNDGSLDIEFTPGIDDAICCAIGVQEVEENEIPPGQVESVHAFGGYDKNILTWDRIDDTDLWGYYIERRVNNGDWEQITPTPHSMDSYWDRDVVAGTDYQYRVTSIDAFDNESEPVESNSATTRYLQSSNLPVYEIEIDEEDLFQMNSDVWSDEYREADIILEQTSFNNSGIRYRGAWTRIQAKKSFRISLPGGEVYRGQERLNLVADMHDPSLIREVLTQECFQLVTDDTPNAQHVSVALYNEFMGVYTDLEPVKNPFLWRRGFSSEGNLYKAHSNLTILGNEPLYQTYYEKENNEGTGWNDIIEFIEWLSESSDNQFVEEVEDRFALDDFLDAHTAEIALANHDFASSNYMMYNNPLTGQWHFFPFDNDGCFFFPDLPVDLNTIEHPSPVDNRHNALVDRVLGIPLYRYAFTRKLQRYVDSYMNRNYLEPLVNYLHTNITWDAHRDVYKFGRDNNEFFDNGDDDILEFIDQRETYLLDTLDLFLPVVEIGPYFRFNEIQLNNLSTIRDESSDYDPWVEIINLSHVELDLEGFILRQNGNSWTLSGNLVVDEQGFLVIWLDGETNEGSNHCSFLYNPEGGNLILESPGGYDSDDINPPVLGNDVSWSRDEDGTGVWTQNLPPTPGTTNTPDWDIFNLVINEFLAINDDINQDEAGEYDDWVEIYNPSPIDISISGLYLTDDLEEPTKWQFPDVTIPVEGFIIVWCDDDIDQGDLHTFFRLSGDGEHVGLFATDGISPIDMKMYNPQVPDISVGRYPDGYDGWGPMTPTPGSQNEVLHTGIAESSISETPISYRLWNLYPNPFNSSTVIKFELPFDSNVEVSIFDILGRNVVDLVRGQHPKGSHSVVFHAEDYSSGIYFCVLKAGDNSAVKKIVLLK